MELASFEFGARTRIVFGPGSLARLGTLVRELGARRVLLVSDPGLTAAGHVMRALQVLEDAGCKPLPYTDVTEDPDTRDVARCVEAAEVANPDLFVGLGGGSAIDVAKGAAMLLANGGRMRDYWGFGKTRAPLMPLVAVPTTAGTGSEVQSYALISDEETHQKMACGAADAAPRVALLDPELTLTCPRFVTACAGLDAIGHALETAVTTKRTELSALFSREAFRLLAANFARVLAEPDDLAARGAMLLGACWAGLAIEHSMLGAAHALANPLSSRCGLAHGLAVGLMLPAVVRFNTEVAAPRYEELARSSGLGGEDRPLLPFLARCFQAAGIPGSLSEHGVRAASVPDLAEEASRQWTLKFNPRTASRLDLERLLSESLGRS